MSTWTLTLDLSVQLLLHLAWLVDYLTVLALGSRVVRCGRLARGGRGYRERLLLDVKGTLNHADCLLLVAQSSKATKSHIIRPIEPSIVLRMLHAIRPVALTLKVFRELPSS